MSRKRVAQPGSPITPRGNRITNTNAETHMGDRLAKAAGAIDKRELSPSFLTADTVTHATRAHRAIPSSVNSIASSNSEGTKRKPCSDIVSFPNVRMKYVPGVEIQLSKKIALTESFQTNHTYPANAGKSPAKHTAIFRSTSDPERRNW